MKKKSHNIFISQDKVLYLYNNLKQTDMKQCDRCGEVCVSQTMSYFNTDMICPACDGTERAHPDFKKAQDAEMAQVRSGNMNYKGIGLPPSLKSMYNHKNTKPWR